MMSYWKRVDERLIKRGMLIMDLDFVGNYRDELVRMNWKKRGRPYRIAESYVRFLAVIRYLFSLGYRQQDRLAGRRFCGVQSEECRRPSSHSPGLNRCQGL
jgi:hypothetical protein